MRVWVSVGSERHADPAQRSYGGGGVASAHDYGIGMADLEAHELPRYGAGKKGAEADGEVDEDGSQSTGLHVISV